MITKILVRRRIKGLRKGLGKIDLKDEDLDDLVRFQRHLNAFASQLFPGGSDFPSQINSVLRFAGQFYARASVTPESPTRLDFKTRFRDDFGRIVEELEATVKELGVPDGCKLGHWISTVSAVLGIIVAILTIYFTCFSGNEVENEHAANQGPLVQGQSNISVSDFYRKLNDFDHHFKSVSFDSAVYQFQKRGTYGAGVYIGGMIRFAEEARRERDAIIDSCLVRIRELGVNTDTLQFSPRLPIRVGQALKGRAEQLGLEPSALREVLLADTL